MVGGTTAEDEPRVVVVYKPGDDNYTARNTVDNKVGRVEAE